MGASSAVSLSIVQRRYVSIMVKQSMIAKMLVHFEAVNSGKLVIKSVVSPLL